MERSTKILLAIIFLAVLGLRLVVAFQAPGLEYETYDLVRNIKHIQETGLPLFNDPLSFGGRMRFFSPLYHYILAGFSFLIPIELVLKIIPNISASLTILAVFAFSKYISENDKTSLLAAIFSGIVPIFFISTINNASIYNAVLPLFVITCYYFIKTNQEPKHVNKLILSLIILTILHPISLILVISFLVYLVLIKSMGFKESLRESEVVMFFVFLALWVVLIVYKFALSAHGGLIIWQNLPIELLEQDFSQISVLGAVYTIGVVPLIFGLISIYNNLFSSKKKSTTFLMSITITIFILLWFELIKLSIGLILLGIILCILSADSLNKAFSSISKLKFKFAPHIFVILILAVAILTFMPSVNVASAQAKQVPSSQDINAMKWLQENSRENATVLALPKEGMMVSYYSNRKNIIDEDYINILNIDQRFQDVNVIYTEKFLTSALETLNYYKVDYIFLSEYNQKKNTITDIGIDDDSCLPQVYPRESGLNPQEPKIYLVRCGLSKTG